MQETFHELINYLKNPILEKDDNQDTLYRFQKFLHLLIISILTAMVSLALIGLVDKLGLVNLAEDHKAEELFKSLPKIVVFFLAVILAPLLEETFFRAPLTAFKKGKQFRIAFYLFAILFGFVHITNYQISTNVLLLSPILVLPQTLLGFYLGFIRVRFGLLWAMALHAVYNGIFVGATFLGDLM
ncbi:CPBP family intramembrane glutamic endopeptidase [Tenacibaculum aestuarii]|uniref:CPBP family intramembrane glutamic endopeptidase n=1 Tax=Tenacibaculum aestuarii TaxID=362781 RepID=UPI0038950084